MGGEFPKNSKDLSREGAPSKVHSFGSHLGSVCKLSLHGPRESVCALNVGVGVWGRDPGQQMRAMNQKDFEKR